MTPSARSNRQSMAPTRNSSVAATKSTPAYGPAFRSMRASRPRMERFAPISSAVGNTPATTPPRSAFPARQSRRQAARPRPERRRTATTTSTLPAPSSSSPASPPARPSLFSIFSTPRAIVCRPISPIRTSAASASTHSTTPPSLAAAGARASGSRTERSTPDRSRISMRRRLRV
jgi:hypothetical protein